MGGSDPIPLIVARTCALAVPAPTVALVSLIIPSAKTEAVAPVVNFKNFTSVSSVSSPPKTLLPSLKICSPNRETCFCSIV